MKNKNMLLVGAAILMGLTACGKKPNTPAESSEPASTSETAESSAAHVHSYGEWAVTKTATHTEEGEETRTCECGEKETRPVSKTSAHEWSEWVETKAPTHTEEGKKERTCPCGEKETDTIAKTSEHQYGEWKVTKEATCEETGSKYRECPCGDKDIESIPAKGHTFGDWATIEAQCLVAGEKTRTCSTCGKEEKETIPATGHSYSESWSYTSESHSHECSKCGDKKDTAEHVLTAFTKTENMASGHYFKCDCGYVSGLNKHSFTIENYDCPVANANPNHGDLYARYCECGMFNTNNTWEDGEPVFANSNEITQNPTGDTAGKLRASYDVAPWYITCPIPAIDSSYSAYDIIVTSGDCIELMATYSLKNLSEEDAKAFLKEEGLENDDNYVAYVNILTHMGNSWAEFNYLSYGEHNLAYVEPVYDCVEGTGSSGYYKCTKCDAKTLDTSAMSRMSETELAPLSLNVTKTATSLDDGTTTITATLKAGTIRNGEKVQWILPSGKIRTATVSNLQLLVGSTYRDCSPVSRDDSDRAVSFTIDGAAILRVGATMTFTHAYTHHVDSSLGYCDKCGLTPGMDTNVFSVTGTLYAESENVILDKSTHKVLIDGKEYSAYFSNVYDNTTALDYAGKGHIFNADILVDSGYNFHVGTTISFAEEEKITASMSINLCWDKDIIMHEAGDVSFRSDGNVAYAHDANEDRYWLDDFNGTETTKDAVTILSGSSKSTSWIMVDEVKTDSIGTYTVAILNKGSVAVGDTFDIYDADNNDITPTKTTCKLTKITAVANSNFIPTSLTVGESYRFYLKTFTLTMNKGGTISETDTTETNIIQGRYCAFGIE